jgi:hypothetical protein
MTSATTINWQVRVIKSTDWLDMKIKRKRENSKTDLYYEFPKSIASESEEIHEKYKKTDTIAVEK